jgi:hypothetical protein
MFIKIFFIILTIIFILCLYKYLTKLNINNLENFKQIKPFNNDNLKKKNNFTKQFFNKKSNDNKKLQKLVDSYEKITPCNGGYWKLDNFNFNFD